MTLNKKMKHLKKYNENKKETLDDIHDICLELEDEGFKIEIRPRNPWLENLYSVNISKYDEYFKYNEVKETMLRLKNYLDNYNKYNSVYITTAQRNYACHCIFDENFLYSKMLTVYKTDKADIIDITNDDIFNIEFYIEDLK